MSNKMSIREFIDTELHLLWNQYHNYNIDCKISVKKEFFTNDIVIDGYKILEEMVTVTTEDSETTDLEEGTTVQPNGIEIVGEEPVTEELQPDPGIEEEPVTEELQPDPGIEEEPVTEEHNIPELVFEKGLNYKYIYHVLDDNEDYVIVRFFNNSSLLKTIIKIKQKYPEQYPNRPILNVNSIKNLSKVWHKVGAKYFFNDGIEYYWYCRF